MGLIAKNHFAKEKGLKEVYPSYVDTTSANYMVIDNMYVASILILHYEKEMEGGFLEKLLALGIDMQLSMYYEKLDTREVLKKITYQIGNTGADMQHASQNQIDMNLMHKKYEDAKYIREKLQIDGEELYHLSLYLLVYANSKKNLETNLSRVENLLYTIGLTRGKRFL